MVLSYKYSSKELDRMNGLNLYDHGARMSDPALGRWHSVDPLCEKYYDVSPYVYCHNNPINRIDPDGRDDKFDENGNFIERTKAGSEVLIKNGESFQNITEVDFSKKTDAIKKIGEHYLSMSDKQSYNLNVSNTGNGIPQDAAFSNTEGTNIYDIYLTNGHVNSSLGNCYDFECITYHESTHRYDESTRGGTLGEVNAIIRTESECKAWNQASDNYVHSQAAYAGRALSSYSSKKKISSHLSRLNDAFVGIAKFSNKNGKIFVKHSIPTVTCTGKLPK